VFGSDPFVLYYLICQQNRIQKKLRTYSRGIKEPKFLLCNNAEINTFVARISGVGFYFEFLGRGLKLFTHGF